MLTTLERAPYLMIYLAAMIEGEAVFALASVLVAAGKLDGLAVVVSGALGAATGDQFYFYLFRGTYRGWFGPLRVPIVRVAPERLARIRTAVLRHQSAASLAVRFVPGFRIALSAACAWAHVSPVRFSVLNLVAAFAWAGGLLAMIAWVGPAAIQSLGLSARWGAGGVAIVLIMSIWRLSRVATKTEEGIGGGGA